MLLSPHSTASLEWDLELLGRVGGSCSNTLLLTLLTFTAFITSQTAPPAIGAIMLTSSAPSYTWQLSPPCVPCLGAPHVYNSVSLLYTILAVGMPLQYSFYCMVQHILSNIYSTYIGPSLECTHHMLFTCIQT